ncbi:MAG: carbamoyl-phosphate synthase domain-containing protein [Chitinophagaceae bacterium]
MNTVHVGNYGVKDEDVESSSVKIRGLIGRNLEETYSRKLAQGSMQEYLKAIKSFQLKGGYEGVGIACSYQRRYELHHFF